MPSTDLEKHAYDDDYEEEVDLTYHPSSYPTSSRSASGGSDQPMLHQPSPSKRSKDIYRPPSRKTTRYLFLTLLTTIVICLLVLVRASHASRKEVELGKVEQTGPPQPFAWEAFPFLTRYFGGVRSLVPREENIPEYPSDEEPAPASKNETIARRQDRNVSMSVPFDAYRGAEATTIQGIQECFLDTKGQIRIPHVHVYEGTPQGMPDPIMGGYESMGLRNDVCFDRYGRFGPYGYGYSVRKGGFGAGMNGEREGAEDMWTQQGSIPEVDFRNIKWAEVQSACFDKNKHRFAVDKVTTKVEGTLTNNPDHEADLDEKRLRRRNMNDTVSDKDEQVHEEPADRPRLPRSAIIIRTWSTREYTTEDIIHLRSMISELSLQSGGQYTVHFLIQVKDDDIPIWAEQQIYDRVLENSLPAEFRGMGTLWSEKQMGLIYSGLEETNFRDHTVNGVYRAVFMALQWFAHQHSEYEYFWNWEMDARYTGHWYHLFDRVNQWTKAQPRKGLWERNGRFYIPEVHGTWEDFKQMVRVQSEIGTNSPANIWSPLQQHDTEGAAIPQQKHDTPVWGPEPGPDILEDQNTTTSIPPSSADKDKYEWGVGEPADLITFSTLFDPEGTEWFYSHDISGYNTTLGYPPRRVAIGATTRLSSKLLRLMHRETILKKHHMFSEMWPASISLHHGLKAVYVPHPVYIDRRWPPRYLADVMNSGRNGASGGSRTSAFGGREHNFLGQSWFYNTGFSGNLWRRWLGQKVDNDGGEREEVAEEGRMCLPAMLLHPVKGVELVVEGGEKVGEEERKREADEGGTGVTEGEGT